MSRFFYPNGLSTGKLAELPENAAIHATRVLRLQIGDTIILFNGDGCDYLCELVSLKKNAVTANVISQQTITNESPLNITLLQGISSGDRMDYTIQKAVELGVNQIYPITTERSVVKLNAERAEKRVEHWQNVAISACEQCGRATIPQVYAPSNLSTWLSKHANTSQTRILLNPIGAIRMGEISKPQGEIVLLIGAEGGLSTQEIKTASTHDFQSIVLGPRILRTETAALTAISAIQTLWGDF